MDEHVGERMDFGEFPLKSDADSTDLFILDDKNAFDDFEGDIDEPDMSEHAESRDETLEALTYVAHYTSPTNTSPVKGFFEFDSIYRASSKQNRHDARIRMLEVYGKDAVSWIIDGVKLKRKSDRVCSEQLELDFREPKKARKRIKSKKYL